LQTLSFIAGTLPQKQKQQEEQTPIKIIKCPLCGASLQEKPYQLTN
jgi:hypothetical protein